MQRLRLSSEIKPKRRREIFEDVANLSRPSGSYYVMIALSTVIAAYGLLIDSAAVVVGAMLVAPLMGPIFGIALGLASGSRRLLWSSLQSELVGIAIAIFVGIAIGMAPLRMPIGGEWLVRTQPTLYDLLIALASGLAGAYALMDERMSPALPGVAISVAVLPPLAACGLALAAGKWDMAAGAMMLFTANFFAIQIAGAVVFSVFGMLRLERHPRSRVEDEEGLAYIQFLKRFWVSLLVLLVMAAFMTRTLLGLTQDRELSTTINSTLASSVGTISGARVSQVDYERQQEQLRVTARVLTPRAFEANQVAAMEEELEEQTNQDVHLIVRSLISRDMDREGTVFSSEEDEELEEEERQRLEFLRRAADIISAHLDAVPGAELTDIQRTIRDDTTMITALVRAPEAVEPSTAAEIEDALREQLDTQVVFSIRTSLTREATAAGFVETRRDREISQREALASAVKTVVASWLTESVENAQIDQVVISSLEPREIKVTILSPRALSTDEAQAMRNAIANVIGPQFGLTVEYGLGGQFSIAAPAAEDAPAND